MLFPPDRRISRIRRNLDFLLPLWRFRVLALPEIQDRIMSCCELPCAVLLDRESCRLTTDTASLTKSLSIGILTCRPPNWSRIFLKISRARTIYATAVSGFAATIWPYHVQFLESITQDPQSPGPINDENFSRS